MSSLLNKNRPPVFCPGCAHETVTRALDKAFDNLQLQGSDIVMVSDIGQLREYGETGPLREPLASH